MIQINFKVKRIRVERVEMDEGTLENSLEDEPFWTDIKAEREFHRITKFLLSKLWRQIYYMCNNNKITVSLAEKMKNEFPIDNERTADPESNFWAHQWNIAGSHSLKKKINITSHRKKYNFLRMENFMFSLYIHYLYKLL